MLDQLLLRLRSDTALRKVLTARGIVPDLEPAIFAMVRGAVCSGSTPGGAMGLRTVNQPTSGARGCRLRLAVTNGPRQ